VPYELAPEGDAEDIIDCKAGVGRAPREWKRIGLAIEFKKARSLVLLSETSRMTRRIGGGDADDGVQAL
jgi:hypothetical protein